MTSSIDYTRIVVVVPAYNEAVLLPRCIEAIRVARAAADVEVEVIVVLDSCTDESRYFCAEDISIVRTACRNVGAARRAGFATAPSEATWFVTTDADCTVDPMWLRRHLAHARNGSRMVCGTVRVDDWAGHDHAVRGRYEAGYHHGHGHRHVHGANLGCSAADYAAVGGFASLTVDEDVDVVTRFAAANIPITWAGDLAVTTSARVTGRAPDGFARHLRSLTGEPA